MSSTHWHFLWQRPQQIMFRLSQDYNILFVDPPYPVPLKEIFNDLEQNKININNKLKTINSSLKVLTPYKISNSSISDAQKLHEENTWFIKIQIQKALAFLKWYQPLLWIYDLAAVSMVSQLDERGVIYDCVDSFSAFSWADPNTSIWETELLNKADVVMTSANMLFEERRAQNNNTYLVPNAADYDHFSKGGSYVGVEPVEFKNIKHPRLAFVGAVYEWLDFELLEKIAVNNPDWNLIFIGPQQHNIKVPICDNIFWLGARDYKLLPFYIQGFDLMLIPFLHNEVTRHANPIKLWEYLAAGKPVITTRLPEIPQLSEVIWLSDDYPSFQKSCNEALNILESPVKRNEIIHKAQMLAKINSWDERCKMIRMILRKHFNM
jgi:glycosyltransferase involved in cell wall biosynthesis